MTRILEPGRYGLGDLRLGDRIVTDWHRVSAADIDAFAALTGDRFEIHMSAAAASQHGFGDRVAHGLLVLSIADGLKNQASAQLKARASLGWDWTFHAPVLAEDDVQAVLEVTAMRATSAGDQGVVTLKVTVLNAEGMTVQSGENRLMVYL